ncbi:CDP-diacylglycerol--glycerol-3-phosphate 3-phosphatidyltransferase [Candidatus Pandoraea novymonadis]|uniref:CDP-diacylglycerol--glycerol-3-phosphate 3-phosphatidyltransferase n=1 Tax=Candidatus Pandoraea novymonadis TaxID=1808959 RepID=A0ABX5FD31_9BURK|nr:CDP-diacylglycerol--glycerol-3-phosphate 3-phosphatidyltransferase [Candidatus Pandoraea novymonadis]PSB91689.1 CDP-diacylglycerol--glycerol-3-phosphate 3-phosphatidyltransferase [Candidatus Pandoraea novymonadis]
MPFNLPIFLTWLRIVLIPLIVGVYYFPLRHLTAEHINWVACLIFILASLTDWFDGYLARRLDQTSAFGAFLDPVADKLMVTAALLLLLELGRINALIAVVIIGREIAISALREWMAQMGASRSVAVHRLGKIKTVAQMVAIPLLLYDGIISPMDLIRLDTRMWGTWLIYVASVLTLWSMLYYLRRAWPQIRERGGVKL